MFLLLPFPFFSPPHFMLHLVTYSVYFISETLLWPVSSYSLTPNNCFARDPYLNDLIFLHNSTMLAVWGISILRILLMHPLHFPGLKLEVWCFQGLMMMMGLVTLVIVSFLLKAAWQHLLRIPCKYINLWWSCNLWACDACSAGCWKFRTL